MDMLIWIGIWALVAYVVYRRFKRTRTRSRSTGQRFDLTPAQAAKILGVLAFIPGLWILKVEGWTRTLSIDLKTGHASTTSTFSAQLARAAVYFAIGAALFFAARVLDKRQIPWPPAVQQLLERLGLAQSQGLSPLPMGFNPDPSAPAAPTDPTFSTTEARAATQQGPTKDQHKADAVSTPAPLGSREMPIAGGAPMPQPRFNPPPNWPLPRGWAPPPDWEPDPSWPPAPPGWQFFIDEPNLQTAILDPAPAAVSAPARGTPVLAQRWPQRWITRWLVVAVVAVVALTAVVAFVYHRVNQPDLIVLRPVDSQGNVQNDWTVDSSRSGERIDCSFGSPSRYDKTDGVRSCGGTADSGDACWPAADANHVLCLTDPFAHVLFLIGTQGLSTPRKALTEDPAPFALVLDDGTQCRARIGGAWGSPKEHPDWVGYYGCHNPAVTDTAGEGLTAVWGPRGGGITNGFGGWSVDVGTEDGHLRTHQVVKAYYVGVAAPGAARSSTHNGGPGGTNLITKCGHPPEFKPETIRADSGALVIRMKIVAHCPGGDVLTAPSTRISVTSGGQNIASGTFDLSRQPIVITPNSGGSQEEPAIEHDFRFPLGTFWRLPVSTHEAPINGASQQGDIDLDAKTLLVQCDQPESVQQRAPSSAASQPASTATGPASPQSGDNESASFDALRAIANADRTFIQSRLRDAWIPQLSSKRPGLVADGTTWNNAEILREHLKLRLAYPEVRLLWSGEWSTFSAPDFWITIAGVTFTDAAGALAWCRGHNLDRDHCYAKLVSTTHPVDNSTAYNP